VAAAASVGNALAGISGLATPILGHRPQTAAATGDRSGGFCRRDLGGGGG
jgi:hypothetical protein